MSYNDINGPQGTGASFLKKLKDYKLKNPLVPDFVARRRIINQGGKKNS